jgi:anti-sigma regulatory factor (Ser/Thr protein kinase)
VTSPPGSSSVEPGAFSDVVTVVGRGRLPSDLSSELMDVLAEEHEIVVCDLRGMAAPSAAAEALTPAANYLEHWPGTVVVVCVPDPAVLQDLLPGAGGDRFVVGTSVEAGLDAAGGRLRLIRRVSDQLPPLPTASRDARRLVAKTLLDWQLPRLVAPATLVASELVTNSVVHAVTVVDLTLTQVDTLLRVAVRDHGGGRPRQRAHDAAESALSGRGLLIVQAFTRSWGVFPARHSGKTVWAVLDAASPRERQVPA